MCVPQAITAVQTAFNVAGTITNKISDYNQQTKANEYRAQVAINNIKNANDEARNQMQIGIEKAREEKIEGLKKASQMLARNSSSASSAVSESNLLNLQDIQNSADSNARNILNSYNIKADSYFQKANGYLQSYNQTAQEYNDNLKKNRLNSLGSNMKVASKWYSGLEDIL